MKLGKEIQKNQESLKSNDITDEWGFSFTRMDGIRRFTKFNHNSIQTIVNTVQLRMDKGV